MAAETYEAAQTAMAAESAGLIKQLFGHFTAEWQQVAIASAVIIFILGVGLTEVMKRLNLIEWFDDALPPNTWKRNVQRFAFVDAVLWSLLIMPAIVEGSLYMQAVKVLVNAVVNGVLTLLGFDTIKWIVRIFRAMVVEKLRALVRRQVIEKPSQRGDDIDEDSTLVKFARGKGGKT